MKRLERKYKDFRNLFQKKYNYNIYSICTRIILTQLICIETKYKSRLITYIDISWTLLIRRLHLCF